MRAGLMVRPTALHVAAGEGHPDTGRVMPGSGADVSARDGAAHAIPADRAGFAGHAEVAARLS